MIIVEKLKAYLHHVAASKLIVLGSNAQQVQEWKERLCEFDFEEPQPERSGSSHAHAVLIVDPEYHSDQNNMVWNCSSWHTIIALYKGYNKTQMHAQGMAGARNDIHGWNGVDFVQIGKPNRARLADIYEQEQFWEDSILPSWPDMRPYTKDAYILYAGAGDMGMYTRQPADLLAEIREAFIAGYTRILFYNGDETMQAQSVMLCQRMVEYLDYSMHHELPKNTFIYLCGAPDANAVYNRLSEFYDFTHHMLVRGYFRFEFLHRNNYNKLDPDEQVWQYLQEPYTPQHRDKKFLCFNRVPRPHRQMIAAKLKMHNMLDQGYFSFYPDFPIEAMKADFFNFFMWDETDLTHKEHNEAYAQFLDQDAPCKLNRTQDRDNPVDVADDDVEYFSNSYFSIVNETMFYDKDSFNLTENFVATFLSEKAWKPIMMKHPFVMVGPCRAVSMLKDIGYKSFHPYIDETYDHVVDDYTRMEMVWEQIHRLISMSHDEWLDLQHRLAPIVEHNFNHFISEKKMYLDLDSIASYF